NLLSSQFAVPNFLSRAPVVCRLPIRSRDGSASAATPKPAHGAPFTGTGRFVVVWSAPTLGRIAAILAPRRKLGGRLSPCLERHDLLDDRDGSTECRLYIQLRRIEQVRVGRFVKAAMGVEPVARVPFLDLVVERVAVDCHAPRLQLARPALHARLAV